MHCIAQAKASETSGPVQQRRDDIMKDQSTQNASKDCCKLKDPLVTTCAFILALRTSTAKQVLGNCERMVFASFVGNFILVVNLYNVLVYCCQALSYDSGC